MLCLNEKKGNVTWDIEKNGLRIMNQIMVGTLVQNVEKRLGKQMLILITLFHRNMVVRIDCGICSACVNIATDQSKRV